MSRRIQFQREVFHLVIVHLTQMDQLVPKHKLEASSFIMNEITWLSCIIKMEISTTDYIILI